MTSNWAYFKYNYNDWKRDLERSAVLNDPLKPFSIKNVSKIHGKQVVEAVSDPLSLALEGYDPLSLFASNASPVNETSIGEKDFKTKENDWLDVWISRRSNILIHYTTAEKLSIITSFLPGGEKLMVKTQTHVIDQVKNRLEQLDDFEEGSVRQMLDLSQQEYVTRIDMLNRELVQAWNTEQRVKALKIAIQCSKLLVDTAVMQFYPSKFVLITDILDIFGKLVYERLKAKSHTDCSNNKKSFSFPEDFTPDMVPETAKETCQNWLYKMASIRELVPRLYVEISLLKCYGFLSQNEYGPVLSRLTHMIRGIGHPLVAAYARFYLTRVGLSLNYPNKEYFQENITDFISMYPQILSLRARNEILHQNISISNYLSLYSPALDWLLYGLVHWANASTANLDKLLKQSRNIPDSDLLLRSIISSFKPDYIMCRAILILEYISKSEAEESTVSDMVMMLGQRVCQGGGSVDEMALHNAAWKAIWKLKDLRNYLSCAEPWVQFATMRFSVQQINWLLGDIIHRINEEPDSFDYYTQFQMIMQKIVTHSTDIEGLFTLDNILPAVELFKARSIRVEVCKSLLSSYQRQQDWLIADQNVINNLMQICVILHESVNALTVDDELKHIGELVCGFVRYVSYGRDFEKQLEFYVDARAAFYKLETVHIMLVQMVNKLSVDTRRAVIGKHTKKTAWFVNACAAYCFVTVPGILCPFNRVQLYLLSGQVALLNRCRSQAEDCFKEALNVLIDIPSKRIVDGHLRSTDAFLVSYLSSFMSTLLLMPSEPNTLIIIKGLLKSLNHIAWEATNPSRYTILLKAIDLLACTVQENYLYQNSYVEFNDRHYRPTQEYVDEINQMTGLLIDELLSVLQKLGNSNEHHKQSSLALELFWKVVRRSDTSVKENETLAINLWNLGHKHKDCVDHKVSNTLFNLLQSPDVSKDISPSIIKKIKKI